MGRNIRIEKICSFCGAVFTAQKTTTAYCGHTCASRAYKQRKREQRVEACKEKIANSKFEELEAKTYLSPSEVAKLLSISRSTVYRHLKDNNVAVLQTKGKTRVRRDDIEKIFGISDKHRAAPTRHTTISEFYTVKEVMTRYKIGESWVHYMVKRHQVPKTLIRGKTHLSRLHIDKVFEQKQKTDHIDEWYSVEDIERIYSMSRSSIYHCASENQIPKRKEGKRVYYSKLHFDNVQSRSPTPEIEYYSMKEAMQRFDLSRDSLYHYIKRNNITKIKEGRNIKIVKEELDDLFMKQIKL